MDTRRPASSTRASRFDPAKDFVGVAQVALIPLVLVVPLTLPATTLKEVIAIAQAKPGALNFASAGPGSTSHLAGEVFKRTANIDISHVPYRGAESLTSIVRGDTHLNFVPVTVALDLIQAGKLRPIAVVSRSRIATLPDVPTFAEAGLPEFHYDAWFGLLAHARTPRPIIDQISQETGKILQLPELKRACRSRASRSYSTHPINSRRSLKGIHLGSKKY